MTITVPRGSRPRASCAPRPTPSIGFAVLLSEDDYAPDKLDDLREATTMLAKTARTARRVLGASNPLVDIIERDLRVFQKFLSEFDKPPTSA